jgi:hypothetical protein
MAKPIFVGPCRNDIDAPVVMYIITKTSNQIARRRFKRV